MSFSFQFCRALKNAQAKLKAQQQQQQQQQEVSLVESEKYTFFQHFKYLFLFFLREIGRSRWIP